MYNMNMGNKNAFAPQKKPERVILTLHVMWELIDLQKKSQGSPNPCLLYDAVGIFCLSFPAVAAEDTKMFYF